MDDISGDDFSQLQILESQMRASPKRERMTAVQEEHRDTPFAPATDLQPDQSGAIEPFKSAISADYQAKTNTIQLQGSGLKRKFLAQADVTRGANDLSWDNSMSLLSPGHTAYNLSGIMHHTRKTTTDNGK